MSEPSRNQREAFSNLQRLDPNIEVRWDERTGAPSRVRGRLSDQQMGNPETAALQFLRNSKELFDMDRPDEELKFKYASTDARGNRHVRFQQMYRGLPVFGNELIVHMDSENAVQGINSRFMPRIDLPTEPSISANRAQRTVLEDSTANRERVGETPTLLVFMYEGRSHLAWNVTVDGIDEALDGSETPAKWEYFVDGLTGEILWRYNNLQTHSATTGTGTGKYIGSVTLNTVHNHTSNKYELEDRSMPTTAHICTHDADNGFPPKPLSEDSDNNWSATSQGAEVDCHVYTRMVFDYFLTMHGRNSYNNTGADMHIYAHVGNNWKNASWNGSYVKIGDGDGIESDPFCTLDIIAHEWTHAVTEYTADLIYYGESGALNESMSDVFAALIDGDWLHGEDNWLKTTAPAGRNLADPTNGGQYDPSNPIDSVLDGHQPDHMNDKYTGPLDGGGVHINSGIMNKAAYLIATGGTHRGIRICEGLGREVLGRLYYHALETKLVPSSDFEDMRQAVLDALLDLYDGDPRYNRWRSSIINAFAAVGVGEAVLCPGISGTIGTKIAAYKWTEGWTTANFYTIGAKTYAFLLKEKGTGSDDKNVHIHEVNANGTIGTKIAAYKWTEGWTTANFYTIGAKTYAFLLKEKGTGSDDKNVHIHEVNANGTIGTKIAAYKWTEGWTTANFYTIGAKTYAFLLKEKGTGSDDKNVHIHVVVED
jgi:thermolysin